MSARQWPEEIRNEVIDALGRRYSDDFGQQTTRAADAVLTVLASCVVTLRHVARVAKEISEDGPRMVSSVWATLLLVNLLEGKERPLRTWSEDTLNELPDETVLAAPDGTWAAAGGWDDFVWDDAGNESEVHVRTWSFFGSDITYRTHELLEKHGSRYVIVEEPEFNERH